MPSETYKRTLSDRRQKDGWDSDEESASSDAGKKRVRWNNTEAERDTHERETQHDSISEDSEPDKASLKHFGYANI